MTRKEKFASSIYRGDAVCAALAALGLAGALMFRRLPIAPEYFVARHAGYSVFAFAMAMARKSWGQSAFSLGCMGLLTAAGVLWLLRFKRAASSKSLTVYRAALILTGGVVLFWLTRTFATLAVSVVENAWFFPESANWREPVCLAGALFLILLPALRTLEDYCLWALGKTVRWDGSCLGWARPAGGLLLGWLFAYGVSAALWDAAKPSLSAAAGFKNAQPSRGLVLMLIGKDGSDGIEAQEIEFENNENLTAAEKCARRRGLFRRDALRALYGGETLQMDARALRDALVLGVGLGDGLGRALLLENLSVAPNTEETRGLLDALADERRYFVGARAAAGLSQAYARFGITDRARFWRKRAFDGIGAVASGLLAEPGTDAVTGSVSGTILPSAGARVALYALPDAAEPVAMGPGRLVDSALLEHSGRFEFKDLPQGNYFLALNIEGKAGGKIERATVSGRHGVISVTKDKPQVKLPVFFVRR